MSQLPFVALLKIHTTIMVMSDNLELNKCKGALLNRLPTGGAWTQWAALTQCSNEDIWASFINVVRHFFRNSHRKWEKPTWSPPTFLFFGSVLVLQIKGHASCCYWRLDFLCGSLSSNAGKVSNEGFSVSLTHGQAERESNLQSSDVDPSSEDSSSVLSPTSHSWFIFKTKVQKYKCV